MARFDPPPPSAGPPAPERFTATVRERGDATVVEMRGELDQPNADAARAELLDAAARPAPLLVGDLRQLGFIDSTGLALLIEMAERMSQHGELVLLCPGGLQAHGALTISGVLTQLQVFESEAELERYRRSNSVTPPSTPT